jgi:hypothetical protein
MRRLLMLICLQNMAKKPTQTPMMRTAMVQSAGKGAAFALNRTLASI